MLKFRPRSVNFQKSVLKDITILNFTRPSRNLQSVRTPGGYEDVIYYNQMKEFLKEAQGVPVNSQKWVELRNKHYNLLAQKQSSSKNIFHESMDIQFLRFKLVVIPEQTNCYELISILNFNRIIYKALEDTPVSKTIMRQLLSSFEKKDYKNLEYPFLNFESSEDPTINIDGFENIIQFLIENKFIHDYRSHSVYEKEGLLFIGIFEECFNVEMRSFTNKFSFYFRTVNFTETRYWVNPFRDIYVFRKRLGSRLYRLSKSIFQDFTHIFKRSKNKKIIFRENEKKIIDSIKIWVERLNKNPFHGGDVPDAADIRLFSIFRKYKICRGINFMFKRLSKEYNLMNSNQIDIQTYNIFDDWFSKMSMLCTRDNFYNIRETGYNYNKYSSKEVIDTNRINKPLQETQENLQQIKNPQNQTKVMGVFGNRIKRNRVII